MKDIDKKELNEVVHLSKQILKILYIVFIIAGVYVTTIILKEWQVWSFLAQILKIIAPLFIGLIVAWLFNPFVNKLRKKGVKRGLGASLAYTLFIGVIVLIISLVIPMLTDQINDLVKSLPSIIDTVRGWIDGIFAKIASNEHFDSVAIKNTIFDKIEIYGSGLAEGLPSASINIIKALASGITTFVVGLIIGFFLLVSFDNVSNLLAFLPPRIKKATNELLNSIDGTLRNFVKGTITLSSLVFLVSSLGFWLSGLKSPLLFGLFCGITNVIPYVGPYIGGAPAVIVGFSQSPLTGIIVLAVIIIVQFIEGNLLQPIVMSKTMKLHPVTIMLGLLIFGHFWGILGMIIATPVVAIIKIIFNFFDRKYKIINKTIIKD